MSIILLFVGYGLFIFHNLLYFLVAIGGATELLSAPVMQKHQINLCYLAIILVGYIGQYAEKNMKKKED